MNEYIIALDQGSIVKQGKPEEVITEELMRDLFKVKAEIQINLDGSRYIQYLGAV